MNDLDLFRRWVQPDKTAESVASEVARHWRFLDGLFPVPVRTTEEIKVKIDGRPAVLTLPWPRCGACGSTVLHYSHASYGRGGVVDTKYVDYANGGGRKSVLKERSIVLPYRAEVQLKCTACSAKNYFGIPFSEEAYKRLKGMGKGVMWRYRDILAYLGGRIDG